MAWDSGLLARLLLWLRTRLRLLLLELSIWSWSRKPKAELVGYSSFPESDEDQGVNTQLGFLFNQYFIFIDEETTIDPLAEEPVDPAPAAYVAEVQPVVQPIEQQQVVLTQPQAYVVPQAQYYAVPQTQTYVVPQAQAYVAVAQPQPVLAQPNLVGQPVAVSEPVAVAQAAIAAPSANQFHAQVHILSFLQEL